MYKMNDEWCTIKRTEKEVLYFKRDEVEGVTVITSDSGDSAHMTLIMAGGHQHQIEISVPNQFKARFSLQQQLEYIQDRIKDILKELDKKKD